MDTVKLDEYLRSPCMASSLPYWKAQKTVIPDNMMIIRDDAFFKDKYTEYKDSPYFKLIHRLKHLEKHIEKPVLSKRFSERSFQFQHSLWQFCPQTFLLPPVLLLTRSVIRYSYP